MPSDTTAVIIDVLRATTTLTVALANGATGVLPAASPEEAFRLRERHPGALLCGERDGRKIAGFDLGNSPAEYGASAVAGKTLVFASTNGSQALLRARTAQRRVLGCFANASTTLERVRAEDRVIAVCSGKLGRMSLEDAAFAGWLCARLQESGARIEGAAAALALTLAPRDRFETRAIVQGSSHGRYLRSLGPDFAADVEIAGEIDALSEAFEV